MTQLTGTREPHASMTISVREAKLTKEQFTKLYQDNRDFRFELTAQQELIIVPSKGSGLICKSSVMWLRANN